MLRTSTPSTFSRVAALLNSRAALRTERGAIRATYEGEDEALAVDLREALRLYLDEYTRLLMQRLQPTRVTMRP